MTLEISEDTHIFASLESLSRSRVAGLDVNAHLVWILENGVKLLDELWKILVNDQIAESSVLSEALAHVLTKEVTGFSLALLVLNNSLQLLDDKLAFVTDDGWSVKSFLSALGELEQNAAE